MNSFTRGVKDGVPIALGYLAVAVTLGIAAKNAGLSILQAVIASLSNNASAGEFVGFTLIAAHAPIPELVLMEALTNARYMLMSTALSQKLTAKVSTAQRLMLGMCITDEIFGISVAYGDELDPRYSYGAFAIACPAWALGTLIGAVLGSVLPLRAVSALSVGLYGMFIAIFIPPAKANPVVLGTVALSFALSWLFSAVPLLARLSTGLTTILLTVVISLLAAILFPVKEEAENG